MADESQTLAVKAEEPHIHNFPRSGAGCWCGAMQCAFTWWEKKPGYSPVKKRCKSAAVPSPCGGSLCEGHLRGVDENGNEP